MPYDPHWPNIFLEETRRLGLGIAPLTITFEHTGSTAVPGLVAKPVLDILAGIPEGASPAAYIERVVSCDYVHRGDQGIPGREFFRRGTPRSYHIHLTQIDSAFWRDQLAFRNYLRIHSEARDEYARLKLSLAAQFPRDREAYIAGKTELVRRILGASSQADTGDTP